MYNSSTIRKLVSQVWHAKTIAYHETTLISLVWQSVNSATSYSACASRSDSLACITGHTSLSKLTSGILAWPWTARPVPTLGQQDWLAHWAAELPARVRSLAGQDASKVCGSFQKPRLCSVSPSLVGWTACRARSHWLGHMLRRLCTSVKIVHVSRVLACGLTRCVLGLHTWVQNFRTGPIASNSNSWYD